MIEAPCHPAAAGGFDDPGFVEVGYEERVVIATQIVRPGWDGGAELAILLDQGADQFDGGAGGAAALKGQAHQVHAKETQLRRAALPVACGSMAEGLGGDGLVADHNAVLVDAFLIAPAPVGAGAKRGVGDFCLGDGDVLQLQRAAPREGLPREQEQRLGVIDGTVAVLRRE